MIFLLVTLITKCRWITWASMEQTIEQLFDKSLLYTTWGLGSGRHIPRSLLWVQHNPNKKSTNQEFQRSTILYSSSFQKRNYSFTLFFYLMQNIYSIYSDCRLFKEAILERDLSMKYKRVYREQWIQEGAQSGAQNGEARRDTRRW